MKKENTEPEASPIIFDHTVLSNFTLAQILHVLRRLYAGRAFVSKAVRREIQAGTASTCNSASLRNRAKQRAINQALQEGWMRSPDDEVNPDHEIVELRLSMEYRKRFSTGQSEAMAIARTRNWVFASDDGTAKRFARERGIRVTGTLGILTKAVKSNVICSSVANKIYAQLIEEGYSLK
ncbi:hypothetical protein [Mastigocladopsis repens]|uniref:hypothetical protein n=1 Tax=Mastigocladopsis repens TaxID=221287 RepID=UPI0002E2B3E1|nr:hypothetical protein [Mastigocladopsis repens]